ncbi:ABC transporter ATP-binding protein [Kitasatospora albolonga]|uniref:ABC transporter ATP-binding protein n=1 Tax=Kitasatospora albolonga TaxID=68173 RepID=UPI0035E6B005
MSDAPSLSPAPPVADVPSGPGGRAVAGPAPVLPVADRTAVRRRVGGLAARFGGRLTAIVLVHAAAVAGGLVPPLVLGSLVDRIADGRAVGLLGPVLLILAALVVHAGLAFTAASWSFALGERIFAVLRNDFLDGLLAMPVRELETVDQGEVLSRSTSDMDAVQDITRTGLPETVVGTVTVAMTLGAAFLVDPLVALGCLVGVPPILLSTRWYVRRAPKAYGEELAARAAATGALTETVRGHEAVTTLRLGPARRDAARRSVGSWRRLAGEPVRLERAWFPAVQAGYHLPLLVVVGWGAWLVRGGHAQVGDVAVIALYLRAVLTPLDDLIYWFGEAQAAGAALGRILGVGVGALDLPAARTGPGPAGLPVRCEALTFGYAEGAPVLHSLDLEVAAGERICLVGASGAGKTTLATLLAGALRPDSGRVLIGRQEAAVGGRAEVVLVAQEDHVFHGTVRDNLTLARPEAEEHELWAALASADADGWVRGLPGGLATALGEDGHPPTPAQARQLALARLFLRRPRVLLLDEATAGLSERAAGHFTAELSRSLAGTTVIQVAHDLWTAERSDRVVVLEHGRIVESGAPKDLRDADGPYARLRTAWLTTLEPSAPGPSTPVPSAVQPAAADGAHDGRRR